MTFHIPEEPMEMVAPVCYFEPMNTGKEPRIEARMENSVIYVVIIRVYIRKLYEIK